MACIAGEVKEGFIVDIIILGTVQKDKAYLTEGSLLQTPFMPFSNGSTSYTGH